jgi:hypothetical protein
MRQGGQLAVSHDSPLRRWRYQSARYRNSAKCNDWGDTGENCGGYLAAKSTMQLAIITPKTHIITMGIAHSDLHMREPGILVTMTKQVSQP